MKIYPRILVTTAAVLFFGTAAAGPIDTFQFVNSGSSWTTYGVNSGATPGTGPYASVGASEVFTGSNGLQVTTTYFEDVNKTNGSGGTAVSGYHGHGLGVIGADGSSSRVDNDGEAILFTFANDVIGKSSFFWGYGSSSDVKVFAWILGSWSSVASASSFDGYRTLGLGDVVSNRFLFVNKDTGGNDQWALKGFAVESREPPSVPEPGVFGLLVLSFVGLAYSRRRQISAS